MDATGSTFAVERMVVIPPTRPGIEGSAHWVHVRSFDTAEEAIAYAEKNGKRFRAIERNGNARWLARCIGEKYA